MFNKILIANRGEIAVRIIKTCKRLGVKTCVVFSDADRLSKHVQLADEAIHIGPSPATESYLCADKILNAALQTNSQAVHPGYGFLSENAKFADLLEQTNGKVKFIGPPASAIRSMGSKMGSKRIMHEANVPITPGYHGDDQSLERLKREAKQCGFPLMLKADAGGGGKGMRIVEAFDEFESKLDSCKREAQSSFKDDKILMEKYVREGRHVEVQVFGDMHGNYVSIFERDCSVQRRHQKVFEEAPAFALPVEMRQKMALAATNAARAVQYVGAGTVEFLVDDSQFYFMEMNTRLQVEHPVTEMISGLDLVEWQLRVACGERLPKQEEITCNGHSIECRVYAENPAGGLFLPGSGPLRYVREPKQSSTVRVETGFGQGDAVSIFYDPMISKLVVHGADRNEALRKMERALQAYKIGGVQTNLDFLHTCLLHEEFQKGTEVTTRFIEKNKDDLLSSSAAELPEPVEAALALAKALNVAAEFAPWFGRGASRERVKLGESEVELDVCATAAGEGQVEVTLKSGKRAIGVRRNAKHGEEDLVFDFELDGVRRCGLTCFWNTARDLYLFTGGALPQLTYHAVFALPDFSAPEEEGSKASVVTAPMPGKVVQSLCKEGDQVEQGQVLIVMEAMKMEHQLKAPRKGRVASMFAKPGDLVQDSQELVRLTA